MPLVNKIKDLCAQKGETLASLERKMNFGNGTIRRWGETTPSADKLAKVADFFDVSIDYLMNREPSGLQELDGIYFRLAKGAKELELTENDINAILNLYKQHREKNK